MLAKYQYLSLSSSSLWMPCDQLPQALSIMPSPMWWTLHSNCEPKQALVFLLCFHLALRYRGTSPLTSSLWAPSEGSVPAIAFLCFQLTATLMQGHGNRFQRTVLWRHFLKTGDAMVWTNRDAQFIRDFPLKWMWQTVESGTIMKNKQTTNVWLPKLFLNILPKHFPKRN